MKSGFGAGEGGRRQAKEQGGRQWGLGSKGGPGLEFEMYCNFPGFCRHWRGDGEGGKRGAKVY